jgi:hypothetical protein
MFNMSENMSNMQFRANTLLDVTNMQSMQNNTSMHNMHVMQSLFQYVEYELSSLLMYRVRTSTYRYVLNTLFPACQSV